MSAHRSAGRERPFVPSLSSRRGAEFLGGSFLLAVALFAAGVQTAGLPNLTRLGMLLVLCALQTAFFTPVVWNRLLRDL